MARLVMGEPRPSRGAFHASLRRRGAGPTLLRRSIPSVPPDRRPPAGATAPARPGAARPGPVRPAASTSPRTPPASLRISHGIACIAAPPRSTRRQPTRQRGCRRAARGLRGRSLFEVSAGRPADRPLPSSRRAAHGARCERRTPGPRRGAGGGGHPRHDRTPLVAAGGTGAGPPKALASGTTRAAASPERRRRRSGGWPWAGRSGGTGAAGVRPRAVVGPGWRPSPSDRVERGSVTKLVPASRLARAEGLTPRRRNPLCSNSAGDRT